MSLMKTKPHWCPAAVATNQGWVSPSGELLVSIGGLLRQLEAEQAAAQPKTLQVAVEEKPQLVEEKVEHHIVKEAKIKKPKKGQQVIAEVVEYNVDQDSIIGE